METVPINRCTSGQLPSIGKDRADVEKEAIGSPNVSRFVEATSHKFFLFLKNTMASHTGYFSPLPRHIHTLKFFDCATATAY